MFFFVNYEGIRQNQGVTKTQTVPDANAMQGILPTSVAPAGVCTNLGNGTSNCGPGSPNAANFAAIKPFLNLWSPFTNLPLGPSGNNGNGTEQVYVVAGSPAAELPNGPLRLDSLLERLDLHAVSFRQCYPDRTLL